MANFKKNIFQIQVGGRDMIERVAALLKIIAWHAVQLNFYNKILCIQNVGDTVIEIKLIDRYYMFNIELTLLQKS